MEIKITYKKEEIKEMVLNQHIARFGYAPEGDEWLCSCGYSDEWKVENIKAEEPEKPLNFDLSVEEIS